MSASRELPKKEEYKYVCINDVFDPETEQQYGFYDGVIKSRNIEYKGKEYSFMFLRIQAEMTNLLYRRDGWVNITDDWFNLLEKKQKKEATIIVETPIKKKRGRPRKKVSK
ncbi:MAG: hypothetical protein ACR2M6_01920 [Vampirovibrionia bacterium]